MLQFVQYLIYLSNLSLPAYWATKVDEVVNDLKLLPQKGCKEKGKRLEFKILKVEFRWWPICWALKVSWLAEDARNWESF